MQPVDSDGSFEGVAEGGGDGAVPHAPVDGQAQGQGLPGHGDPPVTPSALAESLLPKRVATVLVSIVIGSVLAYFSAVAWPRVYGLAFAIGCFAVGVVSFFSIFATYVQRNDDAGAHMKWINAGMVLAVVCAIGFGIICLCVPQVPRMRQIELMASTVEFQFNLIPDLCTPSSIGIQFSDADDNDMELDCADEPTILEWSLVYHFDNCTDPFGQDPTQAGYHLFAELSVDCPLRTVWTTRGIVYMDVDSTGLSNRDPGSALPFITIVLAVVSLFATLVAAFNIRRRKEFLNSSGYVVQEEAGVLPAQASNQA